MQTNRFENLFFASCILKNLSIFFLQVRIRMTLNFEAQIFATTVTPLNDVGKTWLPPPPGSAAVL